MEVGRVGTALREAKSSLHGAGPGTGPMLRSGHPELVGQELAAWAAATEMTRGVARDAALAAIPTQKGAAPGSPSTPARSPTPAPAAPSLPRSAPGSWLQGADHGNRQIPNHHRPEPAPRPQVEIPQQLGHASAKNTVTRTAEALITMANNPA